MKKNVISVALAATLIAMGAVMLPEEASASSEQGISLSALMPKKKTTKKTTKKSIKKTTKTSTKTTTATTVTEPATETTTTESNTGGSVLGSVLGGLLGGGASSSSTSESSGSGDVVSSVLGGLSSSLSTIFDSSKTATADKLVGTWTYQEPAVVFESSNVLKNLGGKVASAAIEKKLQTQLTKLGIKKGTMKMTFDKNGNFTQTVGGKTLSGTYTVSGKQVKLSYGGQVQQLLGTTQLDGDNLIIAMEAGKLLKYANVIGQLTGNSAVSTIGSLLSGYDGMELGITLKK